jgi:hypothetical protein
MDKTTFPSLAVVAPMTFNGTAWVFGFTARISAPCEGNASCLPGQMAPDSTLVHFAIDFFVTRGSVTTQLSPRIK